VYKGLGYDPTFAKKQEVGAKILDCKGNEMNGCGLGGELSAHSNEL
jgi:hypothetical protein